MEQALLDEEDDEPLFEEDLRGNGRSQPLDWHKW